MKFRDGSPIGSAAIGPIILAPGTAAFEILTNINPR